MIDRKCFHCNKTLYPSLPPNQKNDDFSYPPDDAISLYSCGNYGSTVFDGGEFTGERLEIFICDNCIKANSDKIWHHLPNNKSRKFKL